MEKTDQTKIICSVLPSSDIAVGHCVILNDVDQPCGRLVAVIMAIEGNVAYCNYLNADPLLSSYNQKLGMAIEIEGGVHNLTPVGKFGVEVNFYPQVKTYCCERISESVATYCNGAPRQWQENVPVQHAARLNVVMAAIMADIDNQSC